MARKEIITDDLNGDLDAAQVFIAVDDKAWTLDLATSNRAKLDKALAPFLAKATPVEQHHVAKRLTAKSPTVYDRTAFKAWAAANDIAIPARGRAPYAIVDRYRAAGGS